MPLWITRLTVLGWAAWILLVAAHKYQDYKPVSVHHLTGQLSAAMDGFFGSCHLRNSPPQKRDAIQQLSSNSSDAAVRIKAHLVRLPELGQSVNYLPLEFKFLAKVPDKDDAVVLALFGKCYSLQIWLEKDYYHYIRQLDHGRTFYTLDDFKDGKNKMYELTRLSFHNDGKSGHCEVAKPNVGSFKATDEYLACPREQVFPCRRVNLSVDEALSEPNKFDLLVIEHLELAFDMYGHAQSAGGQFGKRVKLCDRK